MIEARRVDPVTLRGKVALLDREGRLVTTEAKGNRLEPLVRELLGRAPDS